MLKLLHALKTFELILKTCSNVYIIKNTNINQTVAVTDEIGHTAKRVVPGSLILLLIADTAKIKSIISQITRCLLSGYRLKGTEKHS